ncbi:MAG TPA: hypothetical protein VGE06_13795 [Flavisolibacter sp.]
MHIRFFAATVCLLTGILACNKNPENHPSPVPPVVENARVAVKLNSQYLDDSKVDSANLLWERGNQKQEEKMMLSNDTLYVEAKKLAPGEGRLTIQVFSKIAIRQRNLQFESRSEKTLNGTSSVHIAAPTGYDDPSWMPRVILVDDLTKFTAIVGLRPVDPYFLLKNIPAGFKIEHDRNYTAIPGGAVIVGGGLWKCNTVCTDERGIIENREYFKPLAAQVGNKEWKMVETGVGLFGPNNTSGGSLYFNHW